MRYLKADLLDDVVGTYDQTKTTIQGRVSAKTINGDDSLGPPLNKFIDVFTQAGLTPAANGIAFTNNGRLFTAQAEAGGLVLISLHELDVSTGDIEYVGKIQITLPDLAATTHVFRSLEVLDAGTTNWKMVLTTTANVLINGGTFLVNNIARTDFVQVGPPTIPFANGNNQVAVYFMQDPAAIGAGNLQTASGGSALNATSGALYVHTGVSATHQFYLYDLTISPTYATSAVTGTEATNTIEHAGHAFVNGDQVKFDTLTGGSGLTTSTLAYFVVSSVAGVNYQLALTSGGAAINFTTDITAATIGRAFGISSSNFVHKTGNLPALSGTLLLTGSEHFAQPTGTGFTSIDGFDCLFFATTSAAYLGRTSELTSGITTWPSLSTVNLLGAPNEIVAPIATYAAWSNTLNNFVYSTGLLFVMKSFINNQLSAIFGGTNNKQFEGLTTDIVEFQPAAASTALRTSGGWIMASNASVGQRGLMLVDAYSDGLFGNSFVITKVLPLIPAVLTLIATAEAIYDYTSLTSVYYRTSGFGSISGGWVLLPAGTDLSGFAVGDEIQFKLNFETLALSNSIHAQPFEIYLAYDALTDNSENWEMSFDDSSNGNPSRTAFRLKTAYASTVPALRYIALDLSDVTIIDHDTVAETSNFQYSTDGGLNWSALGTIPNTVGTLVRYTFNTPPGVDIRPALKEL